MNPPPTPLDTDQPEDYQDPSSAAVSWGTYTRMLNTFTAKTIHPTFNFLSTNVAHQWASDFYYLYNDAQTTFNETKTFRKIRIYFLDANQPSTKQTLGGGDVGSFPNSDSSGNWSGNPPNANPPAANTGVTEGFMDISGWTLDGSAPGGSSSSNISPNGWQLGWQLIFTEHKDVSAGAIP